MACSLKALKIFRQVGSNRLIFACSARFDRASNHNATTRDRELRHQFLEIFCL
jgi:hypothetical protein